MGVGRASFGVIHSFIYSFSEGGVLGCVAHALLFCCDLFFFLRSSFSRCFWRLVWSGRVCVDFACFLPFFVLRLVLS